MSGPEHHSSDERELDDFVAGRGPHHARYRAAASEQTPANIDDAVLAQARAALQTQSSPRRSVRRWRVPLSLAATLLLSIGLVSRVQREAPSPAVATETMAEQRVEQTIAAVAADRAEAPMPVSGAAPADAAAPAKIAAREPTMQGKVTQPVAPPAAAPAPPPAALAEADAMAEMRAAAVQKKEEANAAESAARQAQQGESEGARQRALFAQSALASAPAYAPAAPVAAKPVPAFAFVAGRYRSEQGATLELSDDGRFRFAAAASTQTLAGQRARDGDREWLQADGDATCRCSLQAEGDGLRVQSDCVGAWNGLYRAD